MSSNIFHKGVVARSLSTNQTGTTWDDELSVVRDYSRLADEAITETSADMRQAAMGRDWYFWKYSTWLGEQDNTWLEYAWRNYVAVKSLYGVLKPVDTSTPEKILISGSFPIQMHTSHMQAASKDYYWINTFETRIMEDTLDENGTIPNQSECSYNIIDLQDFEDGSVVGYFDSARLHTHDFLTPNLNIIDGLLDSIRVGGIMMIYDLAEFGSLYEDGMRAHEERMHRVNRRIVQREDFEVYHLAHDEIGTVLAYKIG